MTELAEELLGWFQENGRKNLPWQSKPPNIYHVWLSEIMLQQTQVSTVIDYFNNFIANFPDIVALANADEDAVLASWAGLGYYSRARNLHKSSKIILTTHSGVFPTNYSDLLALPGIGESTAGAILSLACNQPIPILDGNVKRVLARYHKVSGHYSSSRVIKELWGFAKQHTPKVQNSNYTQAIMDLGATVCTVRKPSCTKCPISRHCEARLCNEQELFPTKKIKTIKPEKSAAFLVFLNEKGDVYLEKRPNKGIWGGLWSLVECNDNDIEIGAMVKKHNIGATITRSLSSFRHSFSHYDLWVRPVVVSSPGGVNGYYQVKGLSLGLPVPTKKILLALDSVNKP